MMILLTAALAAAAPAAQAAPNAAPHEQHMAMGQGSHDQMKCCDCCKDMAKEHEGHAEHKGPETR